MAEKYGTQEQSNTVFSAEERALLTLLKAGISGGKAEVADRADWFEILALARAHAVLPLLYEPVMARETLGETFLENFEMECQTTVKKYYRLLFLTRYILGILEQKGVKSAVLKGVGAASYYPVPELRKSGDVDILLIDKVSESDLTAWMEEAGLFLAEEQHANHHAVYETKEGISVELHSALSEPFDLPKVNRGMEKALAACGGHTVTGETMGIRVSMLDLPYNAYQLLLHMLQHFLYAGFGLKLLCDWVQVWRKDWTAEERDEFRRLAEESGLLPFTEAITSLCISFLGLEEERFAWKLANQPDMTEFLREILDAEEFGEKNKSRMVVMRQSGLWGYVREFHHQMHLNYPGAGRVFLLWPFLWIATLVRFLKNNRKLQRGSTADILREASRRSRLAEQLKLLK